MSPKAHRYSLPGTLVLAAIFTSITPFTAQAQFSVALTDDATVLSQSLLGSGITIVGTPTLSAQSGQAGTFTNFFSGGGPNQFTLAGGALLTTGIASGAEGDFAGGPNFDAGGPGSSRLSTLSGTDTFDAVVLTIQFMSVNPMVILNYAFASAEYPNGIGSFSDPIGIYFNGTNAALVPGTATPVSVNGINSATNAAFYSQDSDGSTPFNYGGLTQVLTATANVSTTGVNTLEITIADAVDGSLDSALLIQNGSFSAVPEPGSALLLLAGLPLLMRRPHRARLSPIAKTSTPLITLNSHLKQ